MKKLNKLLLMVLFLIIFPVSAGLAFWFPPESVTTNPDIGEPTISQDARFVNIKWCGVSSDISDTTIVVRQNDQDGTNGQVPIEIISLNLVSVQPIGPILVRDGKTLQVTGVKPIDRWEEKSQKSKESSNWNKVSSHVGISYGWPAKSAKLPTQANGLQLINNASSWSVLPVGDDNGDGKPSSARFKLNGKPGLKDTISVYFPKALLKKWDLNKNNTGAFVDGHKTKSTVTKTDNKGLFIRFKIKYPIKKISVGKEK